MAQANAKESSARAETLSTILAIPGVVGEPIWRELADEAEVYLELYKRLSKEPLESGLTHVLIFVSDLKSLGHKNSYFWPR